MSVLRCSGHYGDLEKLSPSVLISIDTAQKMKFSMKNFSSNCDQICSFLRIWSYLLENP